MAFNKNEFVLQEGTLKYGSWNDPHLITPSTDPAASFTEIGDLGYIRQGTIVIGIEDEFVEYLSGTPQKIIRKDLIRRNYSWEFTCNQFNSTNLQLLYNTDVDTGTYTLSWLGNDAPVKTRYGYLLTGVKVDGTEFNAAIWEGEVVTTDKSLNFPGTDYVDIPVMVQAFEAEEFTNNPNDKHNYGMIFQKESP